MGEAERSRRLRPRRAGAGGCRLRRRGEPQRTAPAAADPGERLDYAAGDHRAAATHRDRRRTDPADPAEPRRQPAAGRTKAPLDVVFVSANLTDFDSKLIVSGPKNVVSGPLFANANGSLLASLPTGVYRLSAADIPSAKPVRFTVGPVRTSSENDLLLP